MKRFMDSDGNEHIEEDSYVPLCKNCAYLFSRRQDLVASMAKCGAKENKSHTNLITGEQEFKLPFCTDQRSVPSDSRHGICGTDGKWFVLYIYPAAIYNKSVDEKEVATRSKRLVDLGMPD